MPIVDDLIQENLENFLQNLQQLMTLDYSYGNLLNRKTAIKQELDNLINLQNTKRDTANVLVGSSYNTTYFPNLWNNDSFFINEIGNNPSGIFYNLVNGVATQTISFPADNDLIYTLTLAELNSLNNLYNYVITLLDNVKKWEENLVETPPSSGIYEWVVSNEVYLKDCLDSESLNAFYGTITETPTYKALGNLDVILDEQLTNLTDLVNSFDDKINFITNNSLPIITDFLNNRKTFVNTIKTNLNSLKIDLINLTSKTKLDYYSLIDMNNWNYSSYDFYQDYDFTDNTNIAMLKFWVEQYIGKYEGYLIKQNATINLLNSTKSKMTKYVENLNALGISEANIKLPIPSLMIFDSEGNETLTTIIAPDSEGEKLYISYAFSQINSATSYNINLSIKNNEETIIFEKNYPTYQEYVKNQKLEIVEPKIINTVINETVLIDETFIYPLILNLNITTKHSHYNLPNSGIETYNRDIEGETLQFQIQIPEPA